jgi:hypothetical protein
MIHGQQNIKFWVIFSYVLKKHDGPSTALFVGLGMMVIANKLLQLRKRNLVGAHSVHDYVLYKKFTFTYKPTIETTYNFGLCSTNISTKVTTYSHK